MAIVYDYTDYRDYLRDELAHQVTRNPSYSLRAFAKKLGLPPSTLSEVLKRKWNFSGEVATQVARKLKLPREEAEYFRTLCRLEAAKDPDLKTSLTARLRVLNPRRDVHHLDVDRFATLADWYHLPIYVMARIPGLKLDARVAARKLGISVHEASSAIERLLRLGLLVRDEADPETLKVSTARVLTGSDLPNEALKRFHRQMLAQAAQALDEQGNDRKQVGSETFTFDPEVLPQVKERIERCFDEIVSLAHARPGTTVYHLGIQFFELTKQEGEVRRPSASSLGEVHEPGNA